MGRARRRPFPPVRRRAEGTRAMIARLRRQNVGFIVAVIITSCLTAGCGKTAEPGPTTPTSSTAPATITPLARAHLDQLLTVMEANSINRQTIDWSAVRAEVF